MIVMVLLQDSLVIEGFCFRSAKRLASLKDKNNVHFWRSGSTYSEKCLQPLVWTGVIENTFSTVALNWWMSLSLNRIFCKNVFKGSHDFTDLVGFYQESAERF